MSRGHSHRVGDDVTLVALPDGFLYDLPAKEAAFIATLIGQRLAVAEVSANGYVTLKAEKNTSETHFLMVETRFVGI